MMYSQIKDVVATSVAFFANKDFSPYYDLQTKNAAGGDLRRIKIKGKS